MMAYDEAHKTIRAYEVKRGNGQFDAGKIRSIKRDLMCIQVLLKSNVETAKVAVMLPVFRQLTPARQVLAAECWQVLQHSFAPLQKTRLPFAELAWE
jgi:hypothetical protein